MAIKVDFGQSVKIISMNSGLIDPADSQFIQSMFKIVAFSEYNQNFGNSRGDLSGIGPTAGSRRLTKD